MKWQLYLFIKHIIECLFFGINYRKIRHKIAEDLEKGIINDDYVNKKYPAEHPFYVRYYHRRIILGNKKQCVSK